jgi:hypothetical protein
MMLLGHICQGQTCARCRQGIQRDPACADALSTSPKQPSDEQGTMACGR